MTTASVIIRTKNEEAMLGWTLERVFAQQPPPHEVIVIDSGSTDDTLAIAARYPTRILTIAPEEWNYSRALNRAAAQATGEILVCLSAHCRATNRSWLANLLRHFDDPLVAGVWGPNLRPGRLAPQPGSALRQVAADYNVTTRTWGLSNANSAVRRSLWRQVPFDETMPATEDKAWGRTVMNLGYCIVHEPAAAVWHDRHKFLSAYRRNRAVAAGFAVMFPQLHVPLLQQVYVIARGGVRTVRFHLGHRNLGHALHDLQRLPSLLASIVGGLLGSRRGR